MKNKDNKMFYLFLACMVMTLGVVGATFAYFTASETDYNTVTGNAATVTFGLNVKKITDVDMAYGLIPMRNSKAPYAASHKCRDNFNNAACQMYEITVTADSDMVMFLDGYIITERQELVETRISEILKDEDDNFYTKYSDEDFNDEEFDESKYIKTGVRGSNEDVSLNHTDDSDCLFIENEQIGGEMGRIRTFYMMIWVYDNGEEQNYLQGMQKAYTGSVTFQTAEGNEITATFD